jgi:hypothetical protein
MIDLSKTCVNSFIDKEEFWDKVSNVNKNNLKFTIMNDVEDELSIIAERIFNNSNAIVWSKESLLAKIKDTARSCSYLDFNKFDDQFLIIKLIINGTFIEENNQLILSPMQRSINMIADTRINPKKHYINYDIEISSNDIENMKNMDDQNEEEFIEAFSSVKQARHKYIKMAELITNVFKDHWYKITKYPVLMEYIFSIHDEYYDGDMKNFVKNHSSRNRSLDKSTGFYANGNIILYSGEVIPIIPAFNTADKRPYGNYIFKIVCTKTVNNRFSLHIIISILSKMKSSVDSGDRRFTSSGINCESFNQFLLKNLIPKANYTLAKNRFCTALLSLICDFQLEHPDTKYVITPFEAMYM